MREVVARVHPISIHGTQVLDLELNQGAGEFGGVSKILRKLIGLEFVLSAEDVHQELDDCVHWCESVREEDEPDYDWEFVVEAEGLVEGFVVDEDREEGEDVEEMRLANVSVLKLYIMFNKLT